MNATKLSPEVYARLEPADGGEELTVIVELEPDLSTNPAAANQAERIAAMRDRFEQKAAHIIAEVVRLGGEVLERTWINQTLRARVPKASLSTLSELADIRLVDLPHQLQRD
jgi:hypothetical protein